MVVPFLLLLLLVFISHHFFGLLSFAWLTIVQHKTNSTIKHQIGLWAGHERNKVVYCVVNLAGTVALTYIVFGESQLWHRLFFMTPTGSGEYLTIWAAIWTVVVNDIILSMVAMLMKCGVLVTCVSRGMLPGSRRQVLTLIESSMALYRLLAPIPVWYFYFSSGSNTIVATICVGVYLVIKLLTAAERAKHVVFMTKSFLKGDAIYGRFATQEEVTACQDDCSICQGPHRAAIVLPCEHVFCEECVSEWLDREPTCPNCRHQVAPEAAAKLGAAGGDGSTILMPFAF